MLLKTMCEESRSESRSESRLQPSFSSDFYRAWKTRSKALSPRACETEMLGNLGAVCGLGAVRSLPRECQGEPRQAPARVRGSSSLAACPDNTVFSIPYNLF